jgi:protein transport protein SEC31
MVWDLRKNEPIIKLTDTAAKVSIFLDEVCMLSKYSWRDFFRTQSRWRVVTWNPQVATQLCLASEEDQYPVIQLWDLRFAQSPVKTFEGHQKYVK